MDPAQPIGNQWNKMVMLRFAADQRRGDYPDGAQRESSYHGVFSPAAAAKSPSLLATV
jgi:hypothetical protein